MSDDSIGRNELALGGVLGIVLLGGLFFLYRSLAADPSMPNDETRPDVISAETTPARPATPELGLAPPPINSPPRSGGGQPINPDGTPVAPTSGAPMRKGIRRPGPMNPWFASGPMSDRPRGSGGDEGGGQFMKTK